jgi:hypothetical protein
MVQKPDNATLESMANKLEADNPKFGGLFLGHGFGSAIFSWLVVGGLLMLRIGTLRRKKAFVILIHKILAAHWWACFALSTLY